MCNRFQLNKKHLRWVCLVVLALMLAIVLLTTMDGEPHSIFSGVWCTAFFIYMIFAFLPIRMRLAVTSSIVLSLSQVISAAAWNYNYVPYAAKQVLLTE